MSKYFLRKNEKNIDANRAAGTERLPYFTLFEIKDSPLPGGKSEFIEVAAFWKAKSGKGYSGKTSEPRPPRQEASKVASTDDIPWD